MASNIQVVLRDDVENVGKSGDIVKVKPGFARNYLLPRGLAAPATRGNVAQVEHEKKAAIARAAKLRGDAEAVAKRLEGVVIEIAMQAGEDDRLFGSVGTRDIAEGLRAKGHEVDRKRVHLPEPIKAIGEFDVAIRFGYEVSTTIKVVVKKAD